MPGATRESFGLSMNVYDRLFSFGRKKLGDNWVFDPETIRGELAQGYAISDDKRTITITLRPDATWHDGTSVTAEDMKWSLDRAVSAKSLAPPQLQTGSLTSPDQFKIAGDAHAHRHAGQAGPAGAGQSVRLLRHHDQQQARQAARHRR